MKKISLFLLFVLSSNSLFSYSIEEIEKMKKLGFSNEQILEMQKTERAKASPVSNNGELEAVVSLQTREKMDALKKNNKGLLVICFSKEFPEKGPGYLNIAAGKKGEKASNIGKSNIMEYSLEGQKGPTVFEHIEFNNAYLNDFTVAASADIITSRYYSEFELPIGTYDCSVSRNFITGRDVVFGSPVKEDRHKKFHELEIKPGMATVLSYFWTDNSEFGLDHVMSKNHQTMVKYISGKFGEFLSEIKVQHNK
jgi:hypothetical protein